MASDAISRPLRTSETPFTRDTMTRRVPWIIEQVSVRNPDYPPAVHMALHALAGAIRGNEPLPAPTAGLPDADAWTALFAPHSGTTWLSAEWFFAEVYAYRLILECTGYFHEPAPPRDPFAPVKLAEMASEALPALLQEALSHRQDAPRARLHQLLNRALWANRVDLSLSSSAALGLVAHEDDLLVDDRAALLDHLFAAQGDVHIVTDNAGTELCMDLVLADALLATVATSVMLHVKRYPMFVSDATSYDLEFALNRALPAMPPVEINELAWRLLDAGYKQFLRVTAHPFWNLGAFLRDMPDDYVRQFAGAALVIFKGDLNYRRISGDVRWDLTAPFADMTRFFPAPLAALRTLKSETLSALPVGMAENFAAADPDWLINGRRGVIQFRP